MNNRLRIFLLGIGVSLFFLSGFASTKERALEDMGSLSYHAPDASPFMVGTEDSAAEDLQAMDIPEVEAATEMEVEKEERESLFPKATKHLWLSHFTWGAEFGASIDLSGYDTSTFNIDAVLGYKNNYFNVLGIGAGIHRSLGSGDNFIPLYALMRTSFSTRPRLFFMSLKVGYSFNTMGDSPMFGDTNTQLGGGVNLAISKKFRSYLILAYEFRHFNKRHKHILDDKAEDISLATITFGVNF